MSFDDDDDFTPPRDVERAAERFETFTKREAETLHAFAPTLKIPASIAHVGEAVSVSYASNKWSGNTQNYIHHNDCHCGHEREAHENGELGEGDGPCNWLCGCRRFKSNVKMYLTGRGRGTAVPPWIQRVTTLTLLGRCLDFSYIDHKRNVVDRKAPGCQLFCIPSGKALLIIEDKKRLVAMIWGGKLDVLDVGIVG